MTTLREVAREIADAGREIGGNLSSLILDTDIRPALVVVGYALLSLATLGLVYAGVMGFARTIADFRANGPAFKDLVADFVALLIVAGGILGAIMIGATAGGYAALAVVGATGLALFILARRGRRLDSPK
ncbi:hypothetical protein [Bosea sp. (in: a-proteobacteria)]|uniref:hypothetical protein n=1 Tax=Bosea sp. (in: a-proteobacteria) TaxID=1871050 RepID=UPI002736CB15|nr:hypothetical protein [Bosea sp. (in: a-proteobacteria)]MDP3257824.1 hypothetical protein [Bosea sp. (in: a-proteobacteria)]